MGHCQYFDGRDFKKQQLGHRRIGRTAHCRIGRGPNDHHGGIISAIVIAGAGIAAANLSKYAALPRLVPQILCGIGAAMAIYFMVSLLDGGLGIGIILLLAGAGLGLFASLKKA
ncbi:MAG: hypothetical protein ACKVJU_08665 [Verrucomicrobiales bacterium]